MRHARMRRMWASLVLVAFLGSLIAPAAAFAATPTPTIRLSTTYQPTAGWFYVTGYVGPRYAGKQVRIDIKKPGRTYWSSLYYPKVDKYGRYKQYYKPKLAGRFYVRTRFGTTSGAKYSRIASLYVKRGPGTKTRILLASTTSTRDSGLFERLGPAFLRSCPEYSLAGTFVGSGSAIALGGTGDADVLLTHSPAAERDFMRGVVAGKPSAYKGLTRYKVMYNDFVLVGPKSNPAGIIATEPALAAFAKVAAQPSTFWSRNDNSGTNEKEKEIWAALSNPQTGQSWYKASGTLGMAQALAAANESSTVGYTLADRATWLTSVNLKTVPNLKIVNAGDANYFNQYSVIEVAGARNREGARDFSNWLRTPEAQELIRTFGEYTYPGQTMFVPNAGSYPAGQ